jgi:hypothetical protein
MEGPRSSWESGNPAEGEHFSFLTIVDGEPERADFEREVCSLLDWMVVS